MPGKKGSGTPFLLAAFRENFRIGFPARSVTIIPLLITENDTFNFFS
jgi:hypothetical protein